MKQSYGRFALSAALVCALLAAWLNVRILKAQERTVDVVMVVKEIQPYTAIPEDALKLTAMVADAVPADAVTDLAGLESQYTRALLIPGTVLRAAHLVPAGGSNLAARLAVEQAYEMRAMALQVNEATGVAGTLKEGDPVDVLVAIKAVQSDRSPQQGNGKLPEGTMARVIAQRVPVLYVQRTGDGGLATVVLQVTPQTAEEIAFAQANGMVWLLTSPYGQHGRPAETTGVDQQVFFERYGIRHDEAGAQVAAPNGGTGSGQSAPRSGAGVGGTMGGG